MEEDMKKEMENAVFVVSFEMLRQLFEKGEQRIMRDHEPQSQKDKMKFFKFNIRAEDFIDFSAICLLGEDGNE
jgi:hypothetical protein